MAPDASSKSLDPKTPEFSRAQTQSPRTNASETSMGFPVSHSSSNISPTLPHVNTKNNGFCFPYAYQGTTYYTRPPPPLPPPLPYDGWIPFYPMNHTMNNGSSVAQINGYSHHYSNGYIQSFGTGYSSPHHNGYTAPHYNSNSYQHFFNYNCSNNFPLPTPNINGNTNSDLSAPFMSQMSQVHGIWSGLLGQENALPRHIGSISDNRQAGGTEWRKKRKNKRNKRKKYSKSKGKHSDQPAHSDDEADIREGVPEEADGDQVHPNGDPRGVSTNSQQVHDDSDADGQSISDDEVDGQVNSGISVSRNGHVDAQFRSNGKTRRLYSTRC